MLCGNLFFAKFCFHNPWKRCTSLSLKFLGPLRKLDPIYSHPPLPPVTPIHTVPLKV